MHHDCVPLAHEGQQRVAFRPLGVLSPGLVGESLIYWDVLKVPLRILVEAADPDVAEVLTVQGASQAEHVR